MIDVLRWWRKGRDLPEEIRARDATIEPWLAAGHSFSSSQELLKLVCRAFRLDESDALRLRPNDKLQDLYRHNYPAPLGWRRWVGSWPPDELELETLARDLKRRTAQSGRIDFPAEVTLGELALCLERV